MKILKKTISSFVAIAFIFTSAASPFSSNAYAQFFKKKVVNKNNADAFPLLRADGKFASLAPSKDTPQKLRFDSIVQDEAAWNQEFRESTACRGAETKGMDTYKKCSLECKTVCSVKASVDGVNCFSCQQGGDDTCADIGQWDAPHPWCEPGGICHKDPMLYCTAPFDAVGPRRSKLKCTNCKKRPDMCWQNVGDGTMTYTNCMLGCWDGTCVYKGKYKEKEWDGTPENIHCYECVTPPAAPTCEDMKWGYDWEADCLNACPVPGVCKEVLMTMGGDDADDDGDDDDDGGEEGGEEEGGGGGTRTRDDDDDDDGRKGGGGGTIANPPMGDPSKLGGGTTTPSGPGKTKTKPKGPCEEVADSLRNPGLTEEMHPLEVKRQKRRMEKFRKSLAKLQEKAAKVEKHLKGSREKVASLGSQVRQAQKDAKRAQTELDEARGSTAYEETVLKDAKAKLSRLSSHYLQASAGFKRETASFSRDINALKRDALNDLYRADPKTKQVEGFGRVDDYYDANRDLSRLEQRREMSDRIFDGKIKEMQGKVDRGGPKAEDYQRQLDNLNRGKKDYDRILDSRERSLKQHINDLQKTNGEDGIGPFDQRGLYEGVGNAIMELSKERGKIKRLRDTFAKAAKNNCPPKGADKAAKEIDQRLKEIDAMIRTFMNRQKEIDDGYPISDEEKKSIEESIDRVADGSKKADGVKSMASFYVDAQAEEFARTFDPNDPKVGLKKAFWFTVGVVEGIGKAVKGLIDLGIGTLDLIGETAAKYAGFEDGGIFGTDASAVLQGILGGADGNINLDGLEKLGQGIDKAISGYLKKLSRSSDLDKDLSRAGGQLAGEMVVGEVLIAKVLGKAGTLVRGADELADAGKVINKVADGVPPGMSTGGKIAGKLDDIPLGPKTTPKKPRGPPVKAKDFKGDTLPDKKGVKPKPLDDATAAKLEKENGFRKDHATKMHEVAQKKGVYAVVRDGNPDSVKFMDDPNKMSKPMSAKAKTAKAGPESNKGLVVDPTHPKQAEYWDADIAKAKKAGDTKKVTWLEENRAKAVKTWKSYGDEMLGNGYSVNKKTGVIEYTDSVTGKHFDGVHGDYDLHGVFKPAQGAAGPKKVSFGSGQKFDKHGVDVEGKGLRRQFNDAIDPDKKYFQHGGQDDWIPDPKKVPHKGPDPPVTVFMPDGSTPVRLETAEEMKKFYEGTMGVKWEY